MICAASRWLPTGAANGGSAGGEDDGDKAKNRFPPGWDEERVRRVLEHYENQSEEEAVAEDEAAFEAAARTLMTIPPALVPECES